MKNNITKEFVWELSHAVYCQDLEKAKGLLFGGEIC